MCEHSNFSVSHQNLFSVLLIVAILMGIKKKKKRRDITLWSSLMISDVEHFFTYWPFVKFYLKKCLIKSFAYFKIGFFSIIEL